MDLSQHIISLFNDLLINDSSRANDFSSEMQKIINNPDSITTFIQIATSSSDSRYRYFSLIFARKYFEKVQDLKNRNVDYPDYSGLKAKLLEMILNEPENKSKIAICDIIEIFADLILAQSTWDELPQFALNLIMVDEMRLIGLNLMEKIFDTLEENIQSQYFLGYSTIVVQSLLSPLADLRIQAINCLESLLFIIVEDEDILKIPDLITTLKEASRRAVFEYQDENEVSNLFGIFTLIFFDRFPFFDQVAPDFCKFAIDVASPVNAPQLPWEIRVKVQQILDDAPSRLGEYFLENLDNYIQATLSLSVEVCRIDREMVDYQFCTTFLSCLSSKIQEIDDSDNFYETMMKYVKMLIVSNDAAALQVALFALSCVVPNCPDSILNNPDEIIDIILMGLNHSDQFILFETNELLLNMAEKAPSCLSNKLDVFVEIIAGKIGANMLFFLKTLDAILANADHQTSHLAMLLPFFFQLLANSVDMKNDIVKCIGSALSHAEVNEDIYQLVAPPLTQLMSQDSSFIGPVFSCLGSLLRASPVSLSNDLGNYMQLMFMPELQQLSRTVALLDFVEKLPFSVQPFDQEAIKFCHNVLRLEISSDFGENGEEEGEITEAKMAAIQCLAYLAVDPDYLFFASEMIRSIFWRNQLSGAISIVTAAPLLRKNHCDPSGILSTLFNELYRQEITQVAREMVNAINAIMSSYPPQYLLEGENAKNYTDLISSALKGQLKCFEQEDTRQTVEMQLMPAILSLFEHFLSMIGTNFSPFLPNFQNDLMKIAEGNSRYMRGNAIAILTQITLTLQSPDILRITAASIVKNLKLKHVYLRINVFNSLRILIRSMPDVMNQHQALIREVVMPILELVAQGSSEDKELFEAAVALFIRCIIAYGWETAPNDVVAILSKVDVVFEGDEGKCIEYAEILMMYGANENSKGLLWTNNIAERIAVRTFAQSDWYFSRTPQNLIAFLKNVILHNPNYQNSIIEQIGFNQRVTKMITDRLN